MADAPAPDKPDVTGSPDEEFDHWWDEQTKDSPEPHKGLSAAADGVIAAVLLFAPVLSFGTYFRYTGIAALCGIVFAAAVIALSFGRVTAAKVRAKAILRIIACIAALCTVLVLIPIDKHTPQLYRLRKTLYIHGNYESDELFRFMPDTLPGKTDSFYMVFTAPMAAPDALRKIDISFCTDDNGIAEMCSNAVSKGGVLCGEDSADYASMIFMCDQRGVNTENSEVWKFGQDGQETDTPVYVLCKDSGYCLIYWIS